jgi:3-polyprenyl-4-hydroxybenzoate decarboxylase
MKSDFVLKPTCLINRFSLLFLTILATTSLRAQTHLVAQEQGKGVVYLITQGSTVRLLFQGYSGQQQEIKGRIESMTYDTLWIKEEKLIKPNTMKIAVKDLRGFRVYSLGRIITKSALEIALVSGNIALYHLVIVPASIATGPAILFGISSGLLSYGILKLLFPDKVYRSTEKGWSFRVIQRVGHADF